MAPEPETLRVASRRGRNGRGQAMVLIAVAFIGLLAAMGLAVDGGNLYLAKIRLSHAVDSAALAGALKLPDCCGTATATYGTVQAYLDTNEPGAYVSAINSPMPGRVDLTGCTNVPTLFLGVIGFSSTTICANALAGYGAIDLCIALDDTGSMNQDEIRDLKHGVRSFTYMMNMNSFPTDPTSAKIGLVPFRGGVFETSSGSLVTDITPLTADREVILRGLNELRGVASDPDHTGATGGGHGGSGTSIGVGIKYCLQELFRAPFARPAGSVEKVMILFTDGNNEENVNGEFCLKDFPCGLGVDAPGASPTRTPVRATNTPNPTRTPTHTPNPTIANTPTRTATPNPAWTKTPTRTAKPTQPHTQLRADADTHALHVGVPGPREPPLGQGSQGCGRHHLHYWVWRHAVRGGQLRRRL